MSKVSASVVKKAVTGCVLAVGVTAAGLTGAQAEERSTVQSFSGGSQGANQIMLKEKKKSEEAIAATEESEARARLSEKAESEKKVTVRSFSGGSGSADKIELGK